MKTKYLFPLTGLVILILLSVFIRCTDESIVFGKEYRNNVNNDKVVGRTIIPDCFAPSELCVPVDVTDTIEIPGYCGLHQVSYTVWHCPGTNEVAFTDFEVNVLVWCDSLINSWSSLSNSQLNIAYDQYEYAASLEIEKMYLLSILNPGIQCPTSLVGASFYRNLCYKWCMTKGSRPFTLKMVKAQCGTKCCVRRQTYCYNNGVLEISSPVFSDTGGDCGTWPLVQCNGILIGECERTCGIP